MEDVSEGELQIWSFGVQDSQQMLSLNEKWYQMKELIEIGNPHMF